MVRSDQGPGDQKVSIWGKSKGSFCGDNMACIVKVNGHAVMVTCDNGIQGRFPTILAVQEQSSGISAFGIFVVEFESDLECSPLHHGCAEASKGTCEHSKDTQLGVRSRSRRSPKFRRQVFKWPRRRRESRWPNSYQAQHIGSQFEGNVKCSLYQPSNTASKISRDLAMQLLCQDGQDLYLAMDTTERTSERVEARQGARELRLPGQSLTRSLPRWHLPGIQPKVLNPKVLFRRS